jgi:photosystem II stability/assembly factor-like uncharacterized protein
MRLAHPNLARCRSMNRQRVGIEWVLALLVLGGWCTGARAGSRAPAGVPAPADSGWVNINPGGGGAFTSIGAGPSGMIVAGSDLSGAYRSRDRGRSWDVIGAFRGLAVAHVSAVAFDPRDPRVLYLGTEHGLYRSDDGGERFRRVLDDGYVSAITASAADSTLLFAAVSPLFNADRVAVFGSHDRGLSWQALSHDLPTGLRALKLLPDPADPGRLYLLSGWDRFVPEAARALFRSTDGGRNWQRLAGDQGEVWDAAVDGTRPGTLYMTTGQELSGGWSGAVWRSDDAGTSWSRKAERAGALALRGDQAGVVRVIDVRRDVASSKAGLWESRDGGETWLRASAATDWRGGWQDLDFAYGRNLQGLPKTLGTDLSDPAVIYWADAQFVFAAFDGAHFEPLVSREVTPGHWRGRGIDDVCVLTMAQSESRPERLYAGFYDLGLWRSQDGGESWQASNDAAFTGRWGGHGGNCSAIVADPARDSLVWATNGEKNDLAHLVLLRSDSAAAPGSWKPVTGLPPGVITGLSLDRSSAVTKRTLFVTDQGDVYRSRDDGRSWERVFDGGVCRITAVDPGDGRTVYAGGEGGLWRSGSGGDPGSWEAVGNADMAGKPDHPPDGFRWPGVHAIVPDPVTRGRVYVVSFGDGHGLYRSDDRGAHWSKLHDGAYCRELAIDPADPRRMLLTSSRAYKSGGKAEGSEGVLRSTDGGRSWESWNQGLAWPFAGPALLDVGGSRRAYIGSPGTGFFRRAWP